VSEAERLRRWRLMLGAEAAPPDAADAAASLTGDDLRLELAKDSAKYAEGLLSILLASALVALVVGCLVVYNTFSILVAQRTRELALLRCLGASRAQVFRTVVLESAVVGVIASIAGVLFSLGIARLMIFGRNYFGGGVPDHALVVTTDAVLTGLVVGTATTALAGLLPARTASRVAPLSALSANPEAVTELSLAGRAGRVAGGRSAIATRQSRR